MSRELVLPPSEGPQYVASRWLPNNPDHIEGRVSGQQIVILTQFVKKSG